MGGYTQYALKKKIRYLLPPMFLLQASEYEKTTIVDRRTLLLENLIRRSSRGKTGLRIIFCFGFVFFSANKWNIILLIPFSDAFKQRCIDFFSLKCNDEIVMI